MENTLDRFLKCILDGRNGRCAVGVLMSYFGWMVKTIIMQLDFSIETDLSVSNLK
jgi:hypothetical protein